MVICTLTLSLGVFSVIGVGIGVVSVNGTVWSIGGADNIDIGNNESQTIYDIQTRGVDGDIKIRVGELVNAGAELDRANSSYTVSGREDVANSDIYIKYPNKDNATVIIDESVPDGSGFDIKISNITTRNISKYNSDLSASDRNIEYLIEDRNSERYADFNIVSPSKVSFQNNTYDHRNDTVSLESTNLINKTNHIIIWERSKEGKLVQQIGSSQGKQKEISVNTSNISDETKLAATIHPGKTEPNLDVIYAIDKRSVQFPVTIEVVQKPIHYLGQNNSHSTLSIPVNTNISSREGNISVKFFDQSELTIEIGEDEDQYRIGKNRIDLLLNSTNHDKNHPHIIEVSINDLESKSYNSTYSKTKFVPRRIAHLIENKTNVTAAQNSYIGLNSSTSTTISSVSKNQTVRQDPIYEHRNFRIINTSALSEGEYIIQSETSINQTQITLTNTSLTPKVPTTSIENNIQTEFESTRTSRHIAAKIQKNSESKRRKFVLNSSRSTNKTINVTDDGQYRIEFVDVNTNERRDMSVTVLKDKELVSDVPISGESVFLGQTAPVEIESTYNSSFIHIDEPNTNTTIATIQLATPTEGETTLDFNTYAAANGSLNESFSVTGSGSSIESVTVPGENGTLPPGTYELSVRSEHGIAATSDNATVTVRRRSTNGLTTYTGTEADRSDLANATAVREAIEGDTLSRSQRVGANDTVVYAANASGLTGLSEARSAALETGDDLDRLDGLEFGVRSTASDEAATASDSKGGTPRDSAVHVDETGLYVVADGEDALPTDGEPEAGEEFTAEFRVTDDRLREAASDPPDGHRVTSSVTFDDRSPDGSPGDDRERIAPGDPAGGGTGGGGGSGGTGGAAGGSPGGTAPSEPAGDGRPDGPKAGGGEEETGSGSGDRIDPAVGVGFGPRPSAERRTPHSGAPVAVSARTPAGNTGESGEAEATEAGVRSDGDETGARNDGASPAGAEAGGARSDDGDAERATPTYENAPIRTTAEDVPGFGLIHSLTAVTLAVLTVTRWRRSP